MTLQGLKTLTNTPLKGTQTALQSLKTILHTLFKSAYTLIEHGKTHLHLTDIFALFCHDAKQHRFIMVNIGDAFAQNSHGLLCVGKALFLSRHRTLLLFKKHNTFLSETTSPKTYQIVTEPRAKEEHSFDTEVL